MTLGGFPEVHQLSSERSRRAWFDAYVRTVTSRDVAEVARIRKVDELPRLLALLAAETAQELNLASLGRRLGLDEATVRSYVSLLETEDFRGLVWLRDRLGPAFVHGVVLHAGAHALPFGDRLSSLPMTALWAGAGPDQRGVGG